MILGKNTVFHFDRENNNTYFIGDKNELIRFLANTCDYNNESKNFHSSILSNLNLGNDYYCTHDGIIYIEIKKHPRKYLLVC